MSSATEGPTRVSATPAQERMWYLHEWHSDAGTYVAYAAFDLFGGLDVEAMGSAWDDIIERHEALRCTFDDPSPDAEDAALVQVIWPPGQLDPVRSILVCSAQRVEMEIVRFGAEPIQLATQPPLAVRLLRVTREHHVLLVRLHHIAIDEWSVALVLEDLSRAYEAHTRGDAPRLAVSASSLAEYREWEFEALGSELDPASRISRDLRFWLHALRHTGGRGLGDIDTATALPGSTTVGGPLGICVQKLDADVHEAILERAGAASTPNIFLGAALMCALHHIVPTADPTVCSVFATRPLQRFESLAGLLVNTVPLTVHIPRDVDFDEVHEGFRRAVLDAFDHSQTPYDRVLKAMRAATGGQWREPSVMYAFQSQTSVAPTFAGIRVEPRPAASAGARFPVSCYARADRDKAGRPCDIELQVSYDSNVISGSDARRLLDSWMHAVLTAVADPRCSVSELAPTSEKDEIRLPREVQPVDEFGDDLVALILRHTVATPDAVALISHDGRLTYRDLDRQTAGLATRLQSAGIGPEHVVAVGLPRSAAAVVAMLGVLRAGAAYLPLDLGDPPARITSVLSAAAVSAALTDAANESMFVAPGRPVLRVTLGDQGPFGKSGKFSTPHALGAAALIFTSGSTGSPKGVVVTHVALASYIRRALNAYPATIGTTVIHSSLAFDFTGTCLWGALAAGGRAVVAPLEEDAIRNLGIDAVDFLKITPSHQPLLDLLPDDLLPRRLLMYGGERLSSSAVARSRGRAPSMDVVNHFGPTETTIGCLDHAIPADQALPEGDVPIGRPMAGVRARVLDDRLRPVPAGSPGELYLGGMGLARGYVDGAGLTAARFIADPAGPAGARLYRTGDVVVQSPDGLFAFLGRSDDQVKIRGHRVELGDVEDLLRSYPGVRAAGVVAVPIDNLSEGHGEGALQLIGFAVAADDVDTDDVLTALATDNPGPIVPKQLRLVEALPTTRNGKLDRAALQRLAQGSLETAGSGSVRSDGEATLNETRATVVVEDVGEELAIQSVFAWALRRSEVHPDDDFFAAGGDSLTAAALVRRLRGLTGRHIALREIFSHPTPRAFAASLRRTDAASDTAVTTSSQGLGGRSVGVGESPPLSNASPAASEYRFEGQSVLLTGATGYLGRYLLRELLDRGAVAVHCAVRAQTAITATHRLQTAIADLSPEQRGRLHIHSSDLGSPSLGLDPERWTQLVNEVSTIVHAAAQVSVRGDSPAMTESNVTSTEALLAFARCGRQKSMHLVSSNSVRSGPRRTLYAQSKWQAEQLVLAARRQGQVASIVRLPRLSADSRTGIGNPNDIMSVVVGSVLTTGAMPQVSLNEHWVPVDRAARACLDVQERGAGLWTINAEHPFDFATIADEAAAVGVPIHRLPWGEWARQMEIHERLDAELALQILDSARARTQLAEDSGERFDVVRVSGPSSEEVRRWLRSLCGLDGHVQVDEANSR